MRQVVIIASIATLLSACSGIDTAKKAADDLRDNVHRTAKEVKKWALTRPKEQPPLPVATRYCYRAYQDVLCYRAPMPGMEFRLVGYQGAGAEPPPAPQMQPLPNNGVDKSRLPVNRIVNAQPVLVGLPPEVKDEPKDASKGVDAAPDAAHETLPNPASLPQL